MPSKGKEASEGPVPMTLRKAIAANLRREMDRADDPALKTSRGIEARTAKAVSYKTVDRLLDPDKHQGSSPTLATLCQLADLFNIGVAELLRQPFRIATSGSEVRTHAKHLNSAEDFARRTKPKVR